MHIRLFAHHLLSLLVSASLLLTRAAPFVKQAITEVKMGTVVLTFREAIRTTALPSEFYGRSPEGLCIKTAGFILA